MSDFTKVAYRDGETALAGLHMRPASGVRAAVTVFPTFMNTTPGVEAKARALVEAGYAVFIADFYGPDDPSNFDEARAAMDKLRADPRVMRQRLQSSIAQHAALDPGLPHLAIGFCLGGHAVLELARDGADLLAVASFHGLLATALPAKTPIKPRILVCHGDADALVPRADVTGFWQEMDAVDADWHFHSYAGVDHGFTNQRMLDGSPNPAYNASADRQSWAAMHSLFDEVLAGT